MQDQNDVVLTNMDPQGDLYETYKREFDRNYNGERLPGPELYRRWLLPSLPPRPVLSALLASPHRSCQASG